MKATGMNFTDSVQIGDVRLTGDGYMVADVKVARTGYEIGRPEQDIVRVYRSEEEVFSHDAMGSFAHKPITLDHPSSLVTAENWKRHSIGFTSGDIARDGGFLRVPLMLADAEAVQAVRDGKRELSAGYTCNIDWSPGQTPDGQAFDARQVGIKANHIAVVDAARAGPSCRIGDEWPQYETSPSTIKDRTMAEPILRTVTVDGLSISVTDQGAQAIDKLQRQIADMTAAAAKRDLKVQAVRDSHEGEVAALRSDHQKALDAKAGEIAGLSSQRAAEVEALKADHQKVVDSLTGEVAALKAKQPTADQMDALIADRSNVIDAARGILGDKFDPKGKSNADIRREAASKRLGAAAVADKSDDYVAAAFDTLTAVGAVTGRDPVRDQLRTPAPKNPVNGVTTRDADDAYAAMVAGYENAWKGKEYH
jgi:hypothetical protein